VPPDRLPATFLVAEIGRDLVGRVSIVIERAGGVLEDVRLAPDGTRLRRYRIA
jgi:hypothetical protein